jgi:6-phosphogluconolactonase
VPRHLIFSADNRFVYVLNALTGVVTTLSLDANTGLLKELDSVSVLPPEAKLVPGMPRGAVGTPGANQAPRNTDNDIWAADLHLTPNGRFLYASERTTSTLGAFRVDGTSGKLSYLGSTPTEKQPRGFGIDPTGRRGRLRREDGHDLVVRDHAERGTKTDRTLSDRQGRELG